MQWVKEPTLRELQLALEDCYMLAARKRTVVHRYEKGPDGKEVAIPVGPCSDDVDWDHITRLCERCGLRFSIVRLVGGVGDGTE